MEYRCDGEVAKKLHEVFGWTYQKIANLTGISRQAVHIITGKKSGSSFGCWHWGKEWSLQDTINVWKMIEEKNMETSEYTIFNNASGEVGILKHNEKEIRCAINDEIPSLTLSHIRANHMDEYCKEDFMVLNNSETRHILGVPYLYISKSYNPTIRKAMDYHGITILDDYIKYLGFAGRASDKCKNYDEKIMEHLNDCIDESGKLHITKDDHKFWSYASRSGLGTEGLLSLLGFESGYKRGKEKGEDVA